MNRDCLVMGKNISILLFAGLTFFLNLFAQDLYLDQDKSKYLTGRYEWNKVLQKYVNPGESQAHYLRPDVAEKFKEMVDEYEKYRKTLTPQERKKSPSILAKSAFRSYTDQKSIWDGKFSGRRKMRESVEGKTPLERAKLILQYSSAPSTSRHHWGTDIDINSFDNEYFEKGGSGELLYNWLNENAKNFGFCQPYNKITERQNKGYFQENWHWSFAPVSQKLVRDWKMLYTEKKKDIMGKFEGVDSLTDEMPLEYVTSVNSRCDEVEKNYLQKK